MAIINSRFVAKNGLDNNNLTITNVANPTSAQEAVTLNYLNLYIPAVIQNNSVANFPLNFSIGDNAFTNIGTVTGWFNTAVGNGALESLTGAGGNNTAVGRAALNYTTTGIANTSIGDAAGRSITTGSGNTAVGRAVFDSTAITGDGNVGIGWNLAGALSSGSYNVLIAGNASTLDTGSYNVIIGDGDRSSLTSGVNNTLIGHNSGTLVSGSNNVILGSNTGTTVVSLNNQVVLSDGSGSIRQQFNDVGALSVGTTAYYGQAGDTLTSAGSGATPYWAGALRGNLTSQTASIRQSVISGPINANTLRPSFLQYDTTTGVLSIANVSDTAPLTLSFANGYGSSSDLVASTTTTGNVYSTANTIYSYDRHFAYADGVLQVDGTTVAVTYGITKTPPQYGARFSNPSQARLTFTGTDDLTYSTSDGATVLRDVYGNMWGKTAKYAVNTANDGYVGNNSALFTDTPGTSVLVCNDIDNLGAGSWSIGLHIKFNLALPTTGYLELVRAGINAYNATAATNYGMNFRLLFSATGVTLVASLSNTGTSWDIANAVAASTISTITANKWNYVTIGFDGTHYYVGWGVSGGTLIYENLVASSLKICPVSHMSFGSGTGTTATTGSFQIDDFYFARYANNANTNGSTKLALNTTNNIEGDFFCIPSMQMSTLSGSGSNLSVGGIVRYVISAVNIIYTYLPHGFVGGERVTFSNLGYTYGLPSPITANTVYYVVDTSTGTIEQTPYSFSVSLTSGGAPIVLTTDTNVAFRYSLATSMAQSYTYSAPYISIAENVLNYRDVPHGLALGATVKFTTTAPGGTSINTNYYAVPVSENKLRLATSIAGATTTPVLVNNTWTVSNSLNDSSVSGSGDRKIIYGNGKFIQFTVTGAVGTTYAYSGDGITWTTSNTLASKIWKAICFSGTQFAILSTDGYVSISTDGITWSTPVLVVSTASLFYTITWNPGGNVFVVGCANSKTYSSPTGTTWTVTLSTLNSGTLTAVASGQGTTVMVNNGSAASTAAFYTSNGTNWNAATLPSSQYWSGVAYNPAELIWVAITSQSSAGTGAISTAAAYSNTGGGTWTAMTLPVGGNWTDILYADGMFVIISPTAVLTSAIGTGSWTNQGAPTGATATTKIASGNGVLVATTLSRNLISYNYGFSWSSLAAVNTAMTNQGIVSLCYGKGLYLAVASTYNLNTGNGTIIKSYNGIHWEIITAPGTEIIGKVAYGAGCFVALAYATNVAGATTKSYVSSNSGDTWVAATLPTSQIGWNICVYGNGYFLAASTLSTAAAKGTIVNGVVTWTAVTLPAIPSKGVYYSDGYFLMLTTASTTVYHSKDTITWASSTLPGVPAANAGTTPAISIAAGGVGKFIVLGSTGLYYSTIELDTTAGATNSRTWSTQTVPLSSTIQTSLSFKDGVFASLSNAGVWYSTDGLSWTSIATGATLPIATTQTTCSNVVGNGVVLNMVSTAITTSAYVIAELIPIKTNLSVLTLTDSNVGIIQQTPTSNFTTLNRLYLGELYNTSVIGYSYRGEYLSDWFPVAVNTTYTKNHNIGTGSVTTDTFFNRFKSDMQSYEVDAASRTTASYASGTGITTNTYYGYGCQTMSIDQNNVIIRTGTTGLDYFTNAFNYTASDFGGATTGYYKIKVSRSW